MSNAATNSYQRTRFLLATGSLACFGMFWCLGHLFHIPVYRHCQASLLQQPGLVLTLLLVAVVLAAAVLVGTVIAGTVHFSAGLAVAAVGLSALSIRGGSSRYTVFWGLAQVGSPKMFLQLAAETALLAAMLAGCWWILCRWASRAQMDNPITVVDDNNPYLAMLAQVAVTGVALLILAASEAKQQSLAAVFLASLAGPLIIQPLLPTSGRYWVWLAPMLVGIIGFVAASINPTGIATASLSGPLAALARPLPLDYASAGTAGALVGYWMTHTSSDAEEQPS